MVGVNRVTLVGNVGETPKIGITKSNKAMATFSIATTSKFTKDNGDVEESFHRNSNQI